MQKHILVVDDEFSLRCCVAKLLRDTGYRVSEAKDGEEALEFILNKQKEKEPLDLLLTDNKMPKMSGVDLVHELRRRRISTPAIFISGSLDKELIEKLLTIGCSGVFNKPFDSQELLQKIGSILKETKKRKTGMTLQPVT